jgi:hypothetical protein
VGPLVTRPDIEAAKMVLNQAVLLTSDLLVGENCPDQIGLLNVQHLQRNPELRIIFDTQRAELEPTHRWRQHFQLVVLQVQVWQFCPLIYSALQGYELVMWKIQVLQTLAIAQRAGESLKLVVRNLRIEQ